MTKLIAFFEYEHRFAECDSTGASSPKDRHFSLDNLVMIGTRPIQISFFESWAFVPPNDEFRFQQIRITALYVGTNLGVDYVRISSPKIRREGIFNKNCIVDADIELYLLKK